jgi:hypothetical protein
MNRNLCKGNHIPCVETVLQNVESLSVNLRDELQASDIPLLASPQGGEAASSRKFREATQADAAGVVFLFLLNRKTTPSALSVDASRHFLTRATTPPCGDARRGISLARESFHNLCDRYD